MAEVLGTVVGVVSLGMQVYSGISSYLDGIQCRKEDIESTTRHCKSMETLLKQIASLQTRLPASATANGAALAKSMSSAETELSFLHDFMAKINTDNVSSKSVVDKIKDQKKKLLYPFRKDRLERLENRLVIANKALHTALQLAETETLLEHGATLRGLETNLDSLSRDFSEMSLGVQKSVLSTHEKTTTVHSTLLNIESRTEESMLLTRQEHMTLREDMAEVKMMMTALMSPDSKAIFQRLMSKPDALRRVCDSTGIGQPLETTDHSPGIRPGIGVRSSDQVNGVYPDLQCHCNTRRISRRKKRHFGPAFLQQETVTKKAHFLECPLADFNKSTQNTWSAGVSVKVFQGLLSAAITTTMFSSFGAGGFGISPSFTYHHINDQSPAFQVVDLLQRATRISTFTDETYRDMFRRGIKALQVIFKAGKSSPFDIDRNGQTLLHRAGYADNDMWFKHQGALLNFLVSVGVSRDSPDRYRRLPFHLAFMSAYGRTDGDSLGVPAVDMLCPDDFILPSEFRDTITDSWATSPETRFHQALTNHSIKIANLYEGHPLEAILLRNRKALLATLEKHPSSLDLSDVDAFGHTVLSNLIGWHDGLNLVLNRFGKSILQVHDRHFVSALEHALSWSSHICMSQKPEICPESCPCTKTVRLLLETDSCILARAVARLDWMDAVAKASTRAQDLTIDSLKDYRQQLKDLALRHLKPRIVDRLGLLQPEVLDQYAGEVLNALRDEGVHIPPHLQTQEIEQGGKRYISRSVYHLIAQVSLDAVSLATAFYSKGFRDIDVPDSGGFLFWLTYSRHSRHSGGFTPLMYSIRPYFTVWLMKHGANLHAQLDNAVVGYKSMHILVQSLSLSDKDGNLALLKTMREFICDAAYLDECRCGCSVNGCHPYTKMWDRLLQSWTLYSAGAVTPQVLRGMMDKVSNHCVLFEEGWDVPPIFRSICLRACTFAVLPLAHTCCDRWGVARHEHEDADEICREDAVELSRLETLLVEFEEKLDETTCSLAEFFRTYWMDRMIQVLSEMEDVKLTADEIDGARELGVSLEIDNDANEAEDVKDPAYWIKRIDALVG